MASLQYTTFDSIQDHVSHVRQIFNTGKPRDVKWRKFQLQRLYDMVSENEEKLYEAMAKDMHKPRNEAMGGDIAPVLDECLYFLDVSWRCHALIEETYLPSSRIWMN